MKDYTLLKLNCFKYYSIPAKFINTIWHTVYIQYWSSLSIYFKITQIIQRLPINMDFCSKNFRIEKLLKIDILSELII